ncbi:hypothetical protein FGO68_gene10521 [Halteria grandinella]|uniref:Heat shock protein 70 n=1 Tax=Halteria grandinella TaxID=5974 RepID=A0A8J8NS22_HALGN|nr:hypothetical protein FGO68_gene10521 [Halteria grandinella]
MEGIEKQDKFALGLDLGISQCRMAIFKGNKFEVIPNEQGNFQTPSYVAFTNDQILVGEAAKAQLLSNPMNTIYNFKRLIGKSYTELINHVSHYPFKIEQGIGDRPVIVICQNNEIKKFYPEEILSILLKDLRRQAEAYLGRKVKEIVVTIPVYYNKLQIAATIRSCYDAGFKVLRTIKESQAIALGIYHQNTNQNDRNLLIINLGGGSLDVAVITIQEQVFEVRSMYGDNNLGGVDFIEKLIDFVTHEFKRRNPGENISGNLRAREIIRVACEKSQEQLSIEREAVISCPNLMPGKDFEIKIERQMYENLCEDLTARCIPPIVIAIKDAGMGPKDVDEIVLVGDFTRTPMVQKMITQIFGGKYIRQHDLTSHFYACHGAALEAAVVQDISGSQHKNLLQLDATSRGLGLEVENGRMMIMIPRDSTFPCQKRHAFTTLVENQSDLDIKIYEGDNSWTSDNIYLGKFTLGQLQLSQGGSVKVEVVFDVDGNRNLTVTAINTHTGQQLKARITPDWLEKVNQQEKKMPTGANGIKIYQEFKQEVAQMAIQTESMQALENVEMT